MKSATIYGESSLRYSSCLAVKLILKGALVSIKKLYLKIYVLSALCAQRIVCDAINLSSKGVYEIDLPNKLVTSFMTSYSRYNDALKESRSDKLAEEISKKRKILQEEIVNAKGKKMELKSWISLLEIEADKCCSEGEQEHDIAKVLEANELRKASK